MKNTKISSHPNPARHHVMWLALSTLAASSLMQACAHPESDLQSRIARVANEYIAAHFPEWPPPDPDWKPEVLDHGTFWEFRYILPRNTIGGGPVVLVDKQTMKVTKAYHEQYVRNSTRLPI